MKAIYTVENIDCPNCAAKIENAIQKLEEVEEASLSYAQGLLHVTAADTEGLLEKIQRASDAVEEGVIFRERKSAKAEHIVFTFENIDCPNCAAKIEAAIQNIDTVESASLSYTQGTLHVAATDTEGLLGKLQAAADSVEEGVRFTVKKRRHPHTHVHHHDHEIACRICEQEEKHAHQAAQEHESAGEHVHHHEEQAAVKKIDPELVTLIGGGVLFVIGLVLHILKVQPELISKVLLLGAYLLMGWEVLLSSFKSILKGQIFDENFLMTVATVGAICIGSWEEAAGVMLFFRVGELFEHIAVERSRKSVMDAIDMRPETVQLCDADGSVETIPAEYVRPGDRVLVRAGDRIPVDGIVIKGESAVDTAAMTGESVPFTVRKGDSVMSGCINQSGVLEIEVTAALEDSMVQRILDSVENAAAGKPKLDRFITRFARVYTPIVVGIAVMTAVVPSIITGNWGHWIYTACNFLMISCPCALVLSVPLAFFSGIGAGSSKGILFKDGITLEAIDKVKAVVMDKTGTLTEGTFQITETLGAENPKVLLQYAAALESVSTHPIARRICSHAAEQSLEQVQAKDVQEIAGKGILGTVDGHRIACGSEKLMQLEDITLPEMEQYGTLVHVAVDGAYFGTLVLSDTVKPHAQETIAAMRSRGLYTVLLTGDSKAHTVDFAERMGISETHAELLPTDKLRIMEQVRKERGAVLFVGDGINDTPVLSGADVGAAMGSGADAAMEAADVVLLGSDPQSLLTALDIAKRVNTTARFCIGFALAVKIAIMLMGFLGFANMWLSVFADTGVTILCVLIVLAAIHLYYKRK